MALYVKNNLFFEILHDNLEKPLEIEIIFVFLKTFKLLLCVIYIPPNLSSICKRNITDYLINSIDHFSAALKVNKILICGDLNDYKNNDVELNLSLTNITCSTTRSRSSINKFFISDHLLNKYKTPIAGPPIGNSYHNTLIIKS